MEPKNNYKRQKYPGGGYTRTYRFDDQPEETEPKYMDLGPINFQGEEAFEGFDLTPNADGEAEKRRIEALKRAIEIAKLMDNVNVQNILNIAEQVDKYLTV